MASRNRTACPDDYIDHYLSVIQISFSISGNIKCSLKASYIKLWLLLSKLKVLCLRFQKFFVQLFLFLLGARHKLQIQTNAYLSIVIGFHFQIQQIIHTEFQGISHEQGCKGRFSHIPLSHGHEFHLGNTLCRNYWFGNLQSKLDLFGRFTILGNAFYVSF